jgi:hypothetical protein
MPPSGSGRELTNLNVDLLQRSQANQEKALEALRKGGKKGLREFLEKLYGEANPPKPA